MTVSKFMSDLSARFSRKRILSIMRNESGVSAVEFAIIAPLILLIYFGCIELSLLMRADRKVTATASVLGDLTARLSTVTDADMRELYSASSVMMQPYGASTARLRITSIVDNGDGQKRVAWSDGHNMVPRIVGTTVVVPDGIVPQPGSVIMTEVEYDYSSGIGFVLSGNKTLSDKFYLRPRRVNIIERSTSGSGPPAFGPAS